MRHWAGAKPYIYRRHCRIALSRWSACLWSEFCINRSLNLFVLDCHKPVTMVQLYNLWWVGLCVAGLEIVFYLFCCLNCLVYRQLVGMPVSAKEKRQRVSYLSCVSFCFNCYNSSKSGVMLYRWRKECPSRDYILKLLSPIFGEKKL